MYARLSAALVVLALALPGFAAAQATTAAIEGVVRDAGGGVLPGTTVEAIGTTGGSIATVTDARGEFRFPRLPVGRYRVVAGLTGFTAQESEVDLTVGATTRVEITLPAAGITEIVQVTATAPTLDLSSASVGASIGRDQIDLLPRGRDFTSVIVQAPGATIERQAGGISVDGSSGAENRYVIDGIDTTHPQTGVSAMPLRAELIEEVQINSTGYEAEFGGSTGGVVNAVTRSGTNNWRGGFIMDFQDRAWGGDERPLLRSSEVSDTDFVYINPPKDDTLRLDPGIHFGGPILRDQAWVFGAYQPGFRDTDRTVAFTNGVTNTFPQEYRVHYTTFNVTGRAGPNVLYRGGASFAPSEETGTRAPQDGRTSLTELSDYARGVKERRSTVSGSVDYIAGPRLVISGRVGHFQTDEESTGVNFPDDVIHNFSAASTPSGIAALPAQFQRPLGFLSDILVTDATAQDLYKRTSFGADATWYARGFGDHQIKGGVQADRIANDVTSGYNGDRILYYAGRTYQAESTGQATAGEFGYFRLLNIATLGGVESWNTALFVQDTWRATPQLTLNLGLRTEHERIPNYGNVGDTSPISFGFGQKLAPRLGFAWDPVGNLRWEVYGSFGLYYDVMKYELPRGSFGGDKWIDFFYTWDSPDWTANSAATCRTGSNTLVEQPVCPAGQLIESLDRRSNAADPANPTLEPDLEPTRSNEFQIGVNHELDWQRLVVGARYVHKELARTIEDVGVSVCEGTACAEQFFIGNPGEGITLSLQDPSVPAFPKAARDYDALELSIRRRFSNNWSWHASYTLSRLYGNYSGLASSDENTNLSTSEGGQVVFSGGRLAPNVNRFFDHIENSFDRNGALVFGRLATDRPHRFTTQFNYLFDWNLNVAVNQIIMSGTPVSEEAFVGANIPFFPNGRGSLGRTDALTQTDLMLNQTFRFTRYDVQVGITILNLFDQDAVSRRFNGRTNGSLPGLGTLDFFAGGWDYDTLAAAAALVEPRFNQPEEFQPPRELRLTVRFNF